MDELDEKGISWWADAVGILPEGQPYFTGLIISKLCNDPKYDEKLERLNAHYSEKRYSEKLLAFRKLKEILERVEPRYNV